MIELKLTPVCELELSGSELEMLYWAVDDGCGSAPWVLRCALRAVLLSPDAAGSYEHYSELCETFKRFASERVRLELTDKHRRAAITNLRRMRDTITDRRARGGHWGQNDHSNEFAQVVDLAAVEALEKRIRKLRALYPAPAGVDAAATQSSEGVDEVLDAAGLSD